MVELSFDKQTEKDHVPWKSEFSVSLRDGLFPTYPIWRAFVFLKQKVTSNFIQLDPLIFIFVLFKV